MSAGFGERLRAQRERQQISLETIAEKTKVRVGLLEALERDDLSQWPGGIFRRSYLRSYASAIGIDPEAAVREFVALHPEPVDAVEAIAEVSESQRTARRPPMRLQYLIASAVGALAQPFSHKSRAAEGLVNSFVPPASAHAGLDDRHTAVEPAITNSDLDLAVTPTVETERINHAVEQARQIELDEELQAFDETTEAARAVAPVETGEPEPQVESTQIESPQVDSTRPVDLPAMAQLCTRIVQSRTAADLEALLADACQILDAVGIIVWPWDPARDVLWPSLSHGYPRQMMAKLPTLSRDADNLIGTAFRSGSLQVIRGSGAATSAIVAPLITPGNCTGVLAVECASGREDDATRQALTTILAAQLSLLVSVVPMARSAIA
jgi:cytoskeletal protein RodZ